MKKTLIALALFSLPVAASAEVILYGQIKAGAEYYEETAGGGERHDLALADFGSRIGFKGSEDLGNGVKAIWQFEQGIHIGTGTWGVAHLPNGTPKGRDSFIGLEGGFGRVTAGNVTNPIGDLVGSLDQWEGSHGVTTLSRYARFDQRRVSVNYYSPDFNGFNFQAQVGLGTNRLAPNSLVNNNKASIFGLGLAYKAPFGIFARYAGEYGKDSAAPGTKAYQVHSVSLGYDANNLNAQLGLQYARNVLPNFEVATGTNFFSDPTGASVANTREAVVSLAYSAGNLTPKLSVAYGRDNSATKNRYLQAIVGADYAFSRRTTGLVSAGWLKTSDNTGAPADKEWSLTTGLVHKF